MTTGSRVQARASMRHTLRGRYFLLAAAHLALGAWGAVLIRRGALTDLRGVGVLLLSAVAVALPLLVTWILLRRGCTRAHDSDFGIELRDPFDVWRLPWEALRLVQLAGTTPRGSALHLPGSDRPTALRLDDFVGLGEICVARAKSGALEQWGELELDDDSYRHIRRLVRGRRFELCGWMLSALCGLALWSAAYSLYCDKQVDETGATAPAVIVGKEPAPHWWLLRSGRLVYEFEVPGRGHYVARAGVEPVLYRSMRLGTEIPVRFVAGARVRSRLVGVRQSHRAHLALLACAALGLFLFGSGAAVASAPLKRRWLHAG